MLPILPSVIPSDSEAMNLLMKNAESEPVVPSVIGFDLPHAKPVKPSIASPWMPVLWSAANFETSDKCLLRPSVEDLRSGSVVGLSAGLLKSSRS